MTHDKPLVVQADHTVLVEVEHPQFEEARARLSTFAELQKSPEHIHFYRIDPISIWNAAAVGLPLRDIVSYIVDSARYPVAPAVVADIETWYGRYGLLRFERNGEPNSLWLSSDDRSALEEIRQTPAVRGHLADGDPQHHDDTWSVRFPDAQRGALKHALIKLGYPVEDLAGYAEGAHMQFALRDPQLNGAPFALRPYQIESAQKFWASGSAHGGCGVIVLPCGAGKTVVGIEVMKLLRTHTLILSTNAVAVQQWKRELLEKTTLTEADVGEYTADTKDIRPVTIATYQILTYRRRRSDPFVHFGLFERGEWGLIVYDEVHLLPAPVFRATAGLQARRRLGLTATLIREDGREDEVFSLIGPKRYDAPWKVLEQDGFLAAARCIEVRVPLPEGRVQEYAGASARSQFRIASTNERKLDVVGRLLEQHEHDRVLIIGQFLDQLGQLATVFGFSIITGRTPTAERSALYAAFRSGEISRLIVSKVGNFAIDLPDANVAIQVSGTFGSRQEEAQRLGRILRPKSDSRPAYFYSVVTRDSRDQEFSGKRQLFLTERGYSYEIVTETGGEKDGDAA